VGGAIPYGNLLALPLSFAISLGCGLLNSGPRWRRRLALVLCWLTLIPPFLIAPELKLLRFFAAVGVVPAVFRSLDLAQDERDWSAARRAWLMISVFDSRAARFVDRSFDFTAWGKVLAFSVPSALAAWLVMRPPPISNQAGELALRWLMGATFAYCMFDALEALMRALYRLGGVEVPRFHFNPILARTIRAFWGERWNLVVHQMLRRHCFEPLARRGREAMGMLAAFVGSAVLHFWLVWAADNWWMALSMAAFFAVQGVLMMVERKLGVRKWPAAAAHSWTVVCVLGTSPLFTEPLLRIYLA